MRTFVVVGVSLTLIACAQSPDRIASTQVSDETYQTYTCEHLEAEGSGFQLRVPHRSQPQNCRVANQVPLDQTQANQNETTCERIRLGSMQIYHVVELVQYWRRLNGTKDKRCLGRIN